MPTTKDLRKEHIIAKKLGGELTLHNASCTNCEKKINREIENPTLKSIWLNARSHIPELRKKSQNLPSSLPIGRVMDNENGLPKNLSKENFQAEDVPLDEHSVAFFGVRFAPPGIFTNKPLVEAFQILGVSANLRKPMSPPKTANERNMEFAVFSPDIICRFVAKAAHGAAVAELGLDSFEPFLPDIIMGRSPYISHFVGSQRAKGRKRTFLHDITLGLRNGLLVANVQLFAKFGIRPFQAAVGRPLAELSRYHLSSALIA